MHGVNYRIPDTSCQPEKKHDAWKVGTRESFSLMSHNRPGQIHGRTMHTSKQYDWSCRVTRVTNVRLNTPLRTV